MTESNIPENEIKPKKSFKKWFLNETFDWVEATAYALVIVVIIFSFLFRIVVVNGPSMENTLHNEDRIILTSTFYKPKVGDIVVIAKQGANNNKPIIKRVIATEFQDVDIDFANGIVYVDGKALKEPYIKEKTHNKIDVDFPKTVPENCIFVLGDNRNDSKDSRSSEIGMVNIKDVKGHAVFRLFPLNKFGRLS